MCRTGPDRRSYSEACKSYKRLDVLNKLFLTVVDGVLITTGNMQLGSSFHC